MTFDYDRDAAMDQLAEWDEERRYEEMMEKNYKEYESEMLEDKMIADQEWFVHCYRSGLTNYVYFMFYDAYYYLHYYVEKNMRNIFRKNKDC
jgi:hypothetical protein